MALNDADTDPECTSDNISSDTQVDVLGDDPNINYTNNYLYISEVKEVAPPPQTIL